MRVPRIVLLGVMAVAIGFAGVFGQAAAKKGDAVKEEMKRLEGTWRTVAVELGGKQIDRQDIPDYRFVFSGTDCSIVSGKRVRNCTFTIDPSRSPKWLDVTPAGDKVTWPGIYELKDGTLKVFLDTTGGERVTEFKTKTGTQQVIRTYERVEP